MFRHFNKRGFGWGELRLMLLGAAALGLAAVSVPSPTDAQWRSQALRVIDGDTFDYGGQRIRIADIDTPELEARCDREAVLAAAAARRLRALLAAGPFELHRAGRDEDSYGRKLRIVTRGGRSIGDMLVAEGLARTWDGARRSWCG